MRKVLLIALIALAAVPAATASTAKNPHDQTEPSPSVTTVVSPPTKIGFGDLPSSSGTVAPALGAAAAAGDCGACINTCWGSTVRSGPGDWSGHVYVIQHLGWCGNGAWITNVAVSQEYDQAGWYQLQGGYGPWYSGGCIGCASISSYGYITWNWTAQLIGISHSGTSVLNPTMYAYGGLSY